jgi:hypothetical protein
VLHQYEGHAGVGGCVPQKALEGREATGRGTDADHEGWRFAHPDPFHCPQHNRSWMAVCGT